jgi:hypothetical protein
LLNQLNTPKGIAAHDQLASIRRKPINGIDVVFNVIIVNAGLWDQNCRPKKALKYRPLQLAFSAPVLF